MSQHMRFRYTYRIGEKPRLRRACAYAQSRLSIGWSDFESIDVDEGLVKNSDF